MQAKGRVRHTLESAARMASCCVRKDLTVGSGLGEEEERNEIAMVDLSQDGQRKGATRWNKLSATQIKEIYVRI